MSKKHARLLLPDGTIYTGRVISGEAATAKSTRVLRLMFEIEEKAETANG